MAYTKYNSDWKDYPDLSTPITQAALEHMENGIAAAHSASSIAIADAGNDFTATDVEGALAELQADNEAHVAAADPHTGYVLESLIDAKGDLLGGSAADTIARVAAATANDLVLTSDSAQSTGVKWAAPATVTAVTALPGSPVDGQECYLMDNLTNPTWQWHLRYISAKTTNKWVVVGGPPAIAYVATAQTSSSTAYGDLATAGPTFTTPAAGLYQLSWWVEILPDADYRSARVGPKFGAAATDDADSLFSPMTNLGASPYPRNRDLDPRQVAASTAIKLQYKVGGAYTLTFSYRYLQVTPIALGG